MTQHYRIVKASERLPEVNQNWGNEFLFLHKDGFGKYLVLLSNGKFVNERKQATEYQDMRGYTE